MRCRGRTVDCVERIGEGGGVRGKLEGRSLLVSRICGHSRVSATVLREEARGRGEGRRI